MCPVHGKQEGGSRLAHSASRKHIRGFIMQGHSGIKALFGGGEAP